MVTIADNQSDGSPPSPTSPTAQKADTNKRKSRASISKGTTSSRASYDSAGHRGSYDSVGRASNVSGMPGGALRNSYLSQPPDMSEEDEDFEPPQKKKFSMFGGEPAKDVSQLMMGKTVFQQCNAVLREDMDWRRTHIANSVSFNALIGIAISVNAILIGLETDHGAGDDLKDRMAWFFSEIIFCGIFLAEMLVRQHLDGWLYFVDPWNLLDYHLIILGFVDICMSVFMQNSDGGLGVLTAFRIIRMLRLVRNIRLLRMFREIWILVKGMYDVMPTLGWIALLLALATYCGSVYIVMGLGKDPRTNEHWLTSKVYIGSIFKCMYSLFEVITFDDWANNFVRPLASLRGDMLVVMILMIIWCSFGVLNVIVGVIVERTLTVASENEENVMAKIEECEHELIYSMTDEFLKADTSADDQLTKEEFVTAVNEDSFKSKLILLDIPVHEVEEVFYLLDTDHSGTISAEEFVSGLRRIKGQAQGKDLVMLCSQINRTMRRVDKLKVRGQRLIRNGEEVMKRLDAMWKQTSEELNKRDAAAVRQAELVVAAEDKQKILDKLDRHKSLKFPRLGTPMM